jgi:hypothetical protein
MLVGFFAYTDKVFSQREIATARKEEKAKYILNIGNNNLTAIIKVVEVKNQRLDLVACPTF